MNDYKSDISELPFTVFDMLNRIRYRPSFYLDGELSISRLRSFMVGYDCGLSHGRLRMRNVEAFDEFHEWLAKQLGFSGAARGYVSMLKARTKTEEEAFDLFFKLLDQFCRENGIELASEP